MSISPPPSANRRTHVVFAVAACILFGTCACQGHRPSSSWQLACFAGLVASMGMALWALFHVRSLRGSMPVLALGLFAAQWLGLRFGFWWREVDFAYRLRPRYAAVVRKFASGELHEDGSDDRSSVPREIADIADCVSVVRDGGGRLSVLFCWGGGFPVQHSTFIYDSDSNPVEFQSRSWRTRPLGGHWFAGR